MYSTISQSTSIISPIGFNIALTNIHARLKQRCINVVQRCFDIASTLCNVVSMYCFNVGIDVVSTLCNVENQTDVGFYFIFNVGSTLFQRWSLIRRWNVGWAWSSLFFRQYIFLFLTRIFKTRKNGVCSVYRKVYTEDFVNHGIQYSCNRKFTWRKCIMKYSNPNWPALSCLKPIYLPLLCLAPTGLAFCCLVCFCNSALLSCVLLTEHSWRRAYVLCASVASSSSVCNFQSMKSPVELNSLFLKFFSDITCFD